MPIIFWKTYTILQLIDYFVIPIFSSSSIKIAAEVFPVAVESLFVGQINRFI